MITVTGSRASQSAYWLRFSWLNIAVSLRRKIQKKRENKRFTIHFRCVCFHLAHNPQLLQEQEHHMAFFFFLSTVVCLLLMWRKTLCRSSCNWLIIFYSGNTNPLPPVGVVVTTGRMCLTAGWDCKGAYDIIVSKKKNPKNLLAVSVATQSRTGRHFYTVSAWNTFSKTCSFGLAGFVQTQKWNNREFDHFQVPFSSFLPLFTGLLYPSVNHLFLFMCIWTLLYCQSCCSTAFSVLSQ